MGALSLSQYQERVKLACGNLPDAHPIIAAGMHTTAINNAANNLIRENPDFFPEHQNNTWTIGATAAGDDDVSIPANLTELQRVTCSRDAIPSGAPPTGWTLIQETVVAMVRENVMGLLDRAVTTTDYPTMCARKGLLLKFYPATAAGFETYFRLYGIAGEAPLVEPDDTFRMHADFDSIIIQIAASEVLTMTGQIDAAAGILGAAERSLAKMRPVVARERALRPAMVRVAGFPWGWR